MTHTPFPLRLSLSKPLEAQAGHMAFDKLRLSGNGRKRNQHDPS